MGKIKNGLSNLSIRKSFVLLMLVFILMGTVLSGLVIRFIDAGVVKIETPYLAGQKERYYLMSADGTRLGNGTGIIEQYAEPEYSPADHKTLLLLDFLRIIASPLAYLLCTGAAAMLFFRGKLYTPLKILNSASEKIIANDLDFQLHYTSRDELGKLCETFEKMRYTLEKNNQELWRSVEERKRLNAAFSHDLRTPLTVLRGYTEFLTTSAADQTLSSQKLSSTLRTIERHIKRLESYVQNITAIQKLEEIQPQAAKVLFSDITTALQETSAILKGQKIIAIHSTQHGQDILTLDMYLVLQVYDNLISNAVRYTEHQIDVSLTATEHKLIIVVTDDGPGFLPELLHKSTEPFYSGITKKDSPHFGLGLYICKIICEKHKGILHISNGRDKGAVVTATFQRVNL